MFRTVPLTVIRSSSLRTSNGICHTGLLTACEQDQDGSSSVLILLASLTHSSFSYICLFQSSTCFKQPSDHHQESQLSQYDLWYMSLYVGDRVVCRFNLHTTQV